MDWQRLSIYTQWILLIYFVVTQWIPMYPWNDLKKDGIELRRCVNFIIHLLQLVMIAGTSQDITWVKVMTVSFYLVWAIGHLLLWWIPYLFGVSKTMIDVLNIKTGNTTSFLPKIKNHYVPDTCQFFLALLILPVIVSVWMNLIN